MARFHINKHGVPAPCRATKGNCPLGGEGEHFDTKEAAQEFADKQNEKESSLLPISGGQSEVVFNQDELDGINGSDVSVSYDGKDFSGEVIGVHYDGEHSGNNGVIIRGDDGEVKHIKSHRIEELKYQNDDGFNAKGSMSFNENELEGMRGKDASVIYDGKVFSGEVIGLHHDGDNSDNNGIIIKSDDGEVKHIKTNRLQELNVDGYNVEKEEEYPVIYDRYVGEYSDYLENIDDVSPEEAKETAAFGIVQSVIDKRDLGEDGLRDELDSWNEGSMEYALEDSTAFMSEGLVGGALDMPYDEDEEERVREELEIAVGAAGEYIENVNSGMSPKEAQLAVEKNLINNVSRYFNPGNGSWGGEDGIPPLRKVGEEMSESEIRKAGQLFENIVSRDKAYRFMEDSDGYDGEVLYDEQKKVFGEQNIKKNKIGSTAMDAAKMFYHSPLYGGSLNTGKNVREMRGRYEDWLRTDGQKSE